MKPEKQATIILASDDRPLAWDTRLSMMAEQLPDAWMKHVYEPERGTVEA